MDMAIRQAVVTGIVTLTAANDNPTGVRRLKHLCMKKVNVPQVLRFLAPSRLATRPVKNCGIETITMPMIDSGQRFNEPPPDAMARD
jgi:type II secretory ATPase GspE/PulE/Tfp pilus assembly ATPase PilB-like protein